MPATYSASNEELRRKARKQVRSATRGQGAVDAARLAYAQQDKQDAISNANEHAANMQTLISQQLAGIRKGNMSGFGRRQAVERLKAKKISAAAAPMWAATQAREAYQDQARTHALALVESEAARGPAVQERFRELRDNRRDNRQGLRDEAAQLEATKAAELAETPSNFGLGMDPDSLTQRDEISAPIAEGFWGGLDAMADITDEMSEPEKNAVKLRALRLGKGMAPSSDPDEAADWPRSNEEWVAMRDMLMDSSAWKALGADFEGNTHDAEWILDYLRRQKVPPKAGVGWNERNSSQLNRSFGRPRAELIPYQ